MVCRIRKIKLMQKVICTDLCYTVFSSRNILIRIRERCAVYFTSFFCCIGFRIFDFIVRRRLCLSQFCLQQFLNCSRGADTTKGFGTLTHQESEYLFLAALILGNCLCIICQNLSDNFFCFLGIVYNKHTGFFCNCFCILSGFDHLTEDLLCIVLRYLLCIRHFHQFCKFRCREGECCHRNFTQIHTAQQFHDNKVCNTLRCIINRNSRIIEIRNALLVNQNLCICFGQTVILHIPLHPFIRQFRQHIFNGIQHFVCKVYL